MITSRENEHYTESNSVFGRGEGVCMWKYLRRKITSIPLVKNMSLSQRKRVGGKFILYSTMLLLIPFTGMFLSYNSALVHIVFQVIWGVSMVIGCLIAFESKHESGRRAK